MQQALERKGSACSIPTIGSNNNNIGLSTASPTGSCFNEGHTALSRGGCAPTISRNGPECVALLLRAGCPAGPWRHGIVRAHARYGARTSVDLEAQSKVRRSLKFRELRFITSILVQFPQVWPKVSRLHRGVRHFITSLWCSWE